MSLSSGNCSLAVNRDAASERWGVLRDMQGQPEVLWCPTLSGTLLRVAVSEVEGAGPQNFRTAVVK